MQVRFTFAAPTVFDALRSLGVDPALIDAAERGDKAALDSLAATCKQWEARKANAKTVWSIAGKITQLSAEVAGIRAEGVKAISQGVMGTQKALNSIAETDNALKNGIIQNQIGSNNRIAAQNYSASKQLELAQTQHKAALAKIDASIGEAKKKINADVRQAQFKAMPGSQTISNAATGVKNWFGGLFRGR